MLLGFFAFMRSGEITPPHFDASQHPTPLDIAVDDRANPKSLKVHLKSSKTDRTRKGVDLFIRRTYNSLCPVVAILRYLSMRGFDNGPLFQLQDGPRLTKQEFVARVRKTLTAAGVDASQYSGHSFRIGAATVAGRRQQWCRGSHHPAAREVEEQLLRYIHPPRQALANISQVLVE